MFRYSWLAVTLGLGLGCGSTPPKTRAPEPARSVAAPAPPSEATANPPSGELAPYWPVPAETPSLTARIALGKLTKTPLFAALWPTLAPSLGARYQPCTQAFVEHGQDLLVRGTQEHGYVALLLDAQGLAAVRAACIGSVLEASRAITVKGASEAYSGGDDVLAFVPPAIVLLGRLPEVEAALTAGGAKQALPAHFTLQGNELASLQVSMPEPKLSAEARLTAAPELFSLAARVALPSEELAEKVATSFASFREQAKERTKGAEGEQAVLSFMDSVTLTRSGSNVQAQLALRGSAQEQAEALGQLAAMGTFAVRRYILNVKAAEAKATLAQIVKAYQASLRDGGTGKKPRKLVSLPAVPAAIPHGEKYQSRPEDWKAWAPIHFSISEPQYFQYEVIAAKDGKSAQVIARGDLDGDGESSERRLTVELDTKTEQLTAKGLDETNPLE